MYVKINGRWRSLNRLIAIIGLIVIALICLGMRNAFPRGHVVHENEIGYVDYIVECSYIDDLYFSHVWWEDVPAYVDGVEER